METLAISAISGLLGVSIGALVSYFIAKKQITASVVAVNRQAWINTLRDCISELQAFVVPLGFDKNLSYKEDEKKYDKMNKAIQIYYKIQLLINPKEEDHNKLVDYFHQTLDLLLSPPIEERELNKIRQLQKSITSISQTILKREWERVKKGV